MTPKETPVVVPEDIGRSLFHHGYDGEEAQLLFRDWAKVNPEYCASLDSVRTQVLATLGDTNLMKIIARIPDVQRLVIEGFSDEALWDAIQAMAIISRPKDRIVAMRQSLLASIEGVDKPSSTD